MASKSGALAPGGFHPFPPGGVTHAPPGTGVNMNVGRQKAMLFGSDFDIDPAHKSGARVNQVRSVVNVRLGKATGITSYAWTLPTKPGGSTATVANGTTAAANFTPDVAGEYIFQCVVTFNDTTAITKAVSYVSA